MGGDAVSGGFGALIGSNYTSEQDSARYAKRIIFPLFNFFL
jgi:hypothetical protein